MYIYHTSSSDKNPFIKILKMPNISILNKFIFFDFIVFIRYIASRSKAINLERLIGDYKYTFWGLPLYHFKSHLFLHHGSSIQPHIRRVLNLFYFFWLFTNHFTNISRTIFHWSNKVRAVIKFVFLNVFLFGRELFT